MKGEWRASFGNSYGNNENWRKSPIRPRAAACSDFRLGDDCREFFCGSVISFSCEVSERTEQTALEPAPRLEGEDYSPELSPAQWMMVEVCVRSARMLGIPKSIGEIFGFAFCATKPISFDDVVRVLGLSNGTASHGLRYLRRLGAVRPCYVAQERRDHYVAEISLKKLVSVFIAENVLAHLGGTAELMARLRKVLAESEDAELAPRVDLLMDWNKQVRRATTAAMEMLA